ncbi:cache domain-containing protein [Ramlibacter sp. PS4R-6]|uniref:cache domain-containing protein n=1 Tax=Ramlibacter sp. PS4R-6 TaxID=3133438 RepID=UPI0030A118C8
MSSPPAPSRPSLHALLACLVLAALLPIAGVVAWQVHGSLRAERERTEGELARAATEFAQAVDRELASSVGALRVLSQSELFQQGRITAMGRLLQGRPRRDWDSIFVLDAQGNVVLDTAPRPAPAAAFADVHRETLARLAPVVSALGDAGFAIALPVMQQDQARYVLGVRLAASLWPRLAAAAPLPEDGHARLYDREGRLISQSGGAAPAGARLPPEPLQAMLRKARGVQRSSEADGSEVYAAWDRVPLSGWHARVFVAARPVDAAQRDLLARALSTSGVAILAGLLLAAAIADAIVRRVRRQEAHARTHGDLTAMLTHELPNPRGPRSAATGHPARTGKRR